MGQRRDRLNSRLRRQKLTRAKNSRRKALERLRRAAHQERRKAAAQS